MFSAEQCQKQELIGRRKVLSIPELGVNGFINLGSPRKEIRSFQLGNAIHRSTFVFNENILAEEILTCDCKEMSWELARKAGKSWDYIVC